jgi:hypothetical protein
VLLLLLSQVAKQQGEFLAEVLAGGQWDKRSSRLAITAARTATTATAGCAGSQHKAAAARVQVLPQRQPGEILLG